MTLLERLRTPIKLNYFYGIIREKKTQKTHRDTDFIEQTKTTPTKGKPNATNLPSGYDIESVT